MNITEAFTPETVVPFDRIPEALEQARIQTHTWQHNGNGAVYEFMQSIKQEAITLHKHGEQLTLCTTVAVPYIGYVGSTLLELYEAYQVHLNPHSGKISIRSRIFKGSLGETMLRLPDGSIESGIDATMRGLKEELNWDNPGLYDLSEWLGNPWEQSALQPSLKYPGLLGIYLRYRMHCIITKALYQPEGYTHIDSKNNKKEIFLWRNASV